MVRIEKPGHNPRWRRLALNVFNVLILSSWLACSWVRWTMKRATKQEMKLTPGFDPNRDIDDPGESLTILELFWQSISTSLTTFLLGIVHRLVALKQQTNKTGHTTLRKRLRSIRSSYLIELITARSWLVRKCPFLPPFTTPTPSFFVPRPTPSPHTSF